MGTASLIFGVVLIIIGSGLGVSWMWWAVSGGGEIEPLGKITVGLIVMVPFFVIGGLLVRKFDKDKKKDKILHVDTGETEERSTKENEFIDILKQRYAKGEITKEEFEEKKKDLENS